MLRCQPRPEEIEVNQTLLLCIYFRAMDTLPSLNDRQELSDADIAKINQEVAALFEQNSFEQVEVFERTRRYIFPSKSKS